MRNVNVSISKKYSYTFNPEMGALSRIESGYLIAAKSGVFEILSLGDNKI